MNTEIVNIVITKVQLLESIIVIMASVICFMSIYILIEKDFFMK